MTNIIIRNLDTEELDELLDVLAIDFGLLGEVIEDGDIV